MIPPLPAETVREIRDLRADGLTCAEVADRVGVSSSSVANYSVRQRSGCVAQPGNDEEPYQALWLAVIKQGIRDLQLKASYGRSQVSAHQRQRLARIEQFGEIEEWFESEDFEYVCGLVGVEPGVVRRRLAGMEALSA